MRKIYPFLILAVWLLLRAASSEAIEVVSEQAHVDLDTEKVVYIQGPITSEQKVVFTAQLLATSGLPGDRVVVIDSPGGDVEVGQSMINMLEMEKSISGGRIVCVALDNAHSMAFNLLTHCDVRLATPGSRMLVHKVEQVMTPKDGIRKTAHNLREIARELEKVDEPYRRTNADAMHLSLRDYDHYADAETMWTAEKLLSMHYLNGLAEVLE